MQITTQRDFSTNYFRLRENQLYTWVNIEWQSSIFFNFIGHNENFVKKNICSIKRVAWFVSLGRVVELLGHWLGALKKTRIRETKHLLTNTKKILLVRQNFQKKKLFLRGNFSPCACWLYLRDGALDIWHGFKWWFWAPCAEWWWQTATLIFF